MVEDPDKKFDVTRPNHSPPNHSGRPLIVGHHPVMADPMLRPMHKTSTPQPASPPPRLDTTPGWSAPLATAQRPSQPASPIVPPPADIPAPMPAPSAQPSKPADLPFAPQTPQPAPPPPSPVPSFEPIGDLPPSAQQAPAEPGSASAAPNPADTQPASHMQHHELPITHGSKSKSRGRRLVIGILVVLVILFVGAYLAVDSAVIKTNIKLPVHFFTQNGVTVKTATVATTATNGSTNTQSNGTKVPPNFSQYNDSALPFSFNYPTAWGAPSVTTEQGYAIRGGGNKTTGTYAYFVKFSSNKNVQMVITAGNLLPPLRSAHYYDFLGWCIKPEDKKYYKSVLTYTSAGGIDTPSTVACNQGPLDDAAKIDSATIIQASTKDADGTFLGDVYTKDLGTTELPVVRVLDKSRTNGDLIKIILNNDLASSSTSQ